MKNVNGLADAMRLVESACENGEITIIGHGDLPTAKELLGKCVLYINKMYGVDVLAEVVKDLVATREDEGVCISCEGCSGCAEDGIADEDDTPTIEIDVDRAILIVRDVLNDEMGFLSGGAIEEIVLDFKNYYESLVGEVADEYDTDLAADAYCEILSDNLDITDYDESYIDDVIHTIIRRTDEHIIFV